MPATQGTGDSHGFEDCHPIVAGQSDEIKRAHLTHSRKMYPLFCELTIPNVCECCGVGSSTQKLKVCTGCRRVKYCGRECQKLDWKSHKAFCQSVSFRREGGDNKEEVADIQHMMTWVCDPEPATHGFLYTDGIAKTTPLKLEFIALDIPRDVSTRTDHFGHYDSQSVASAFNFLAERLLDGHDVLPGQLAESNGVRFMIIDLCDEIRTALLENYATRSGLDANLMLVVPFKMLPLTLPPSITLYKWKDATTLLDLALRKSELGKSADVIIPGVLPFLSGFEIGKAKGFVVGEREVRIKKIQNIFRCPGYELAMKTGEILIHQQIYNAFHPHPSGKNSMQRGMLIRHLNGVSADNRAVNLAECSVYEALMHIDDWVTDWTCFLTEEEQQFVRENVDTFRELYARY